MFDREALRALAVSEPAEPVLSVYARTDPRDPANTGHSPAWEIALRNGLRAVAERLEAGEDRELRLSFRGLRERVEDELLGLEASERGRSVAWFVGADGTDHARLGLQLPVRTDRVVWDARPFVSPLVDVADRGAMTGVVLVGLEHVRLLQIEQGEVTEPERSGYEIELGDWREYGGTAGGSPERGALGTSQIEAFEARVEKQRARLFDAAAQATARRLDELGWERVALVGQHQVAGPFRAAAPVALAERIVTEIDANLGGEDASEVAETLEPHLDSLWRERAGSLAREAAERAAAGGAAALGPDETLATLVEGRASHLVLDPEADLSAATSEPLLEALGGPPELLAERAVEAAVGSDAQVTALAAEESPELERAGGMLALLRW